MMSKNENKSALAGVAGAAIVAGVAVASAFVLRDKKNREKVKKVLTNAKDQAVDYMQDVQKKTDKKEKEIEKNLASGKNEKVKLTS
jgi:F0F1-type ATP synthase membrane subunit a